MSAFPTLRYEKVEGVAWITLDRPEVINAFNVQMRDDFAEVFAAIQDDPEVRVVIVSGAGERGFCAGADLTEFGTAPSQAVARDVRWERDVWGAMLALPQPLIAAIHGHCLGSGVEIAALCDVRLASEDAVFGMPETALGLIPAAGGTQTLPRLMGGGAALDLLLAARRLDAAEALETGLVHRVVPRAVLLNEADALARRIIRAPAGALTALKRAVNEGAGMPLTQALDLEHRLAAALAT